MQQVSYLFEPYGVTLTLKFSGSAERNARLRQLIIDDWIAREVLRLQEEERKRREAVARGEYPVRPWSETYGRPEHLESLHARDRATTAGAWARQRSLHANPGLRAGL